MLVGPLAQFSRGAIVEDLVARITETFARNLEARLIGDVAADDFSAQRPFEAGSLVRQVIWARLKAIAGGHVRPPGTLKHRRAPLDLEFRKRVRREQLFRFVQSVDQSLLLGIAHERLDIAPIGVEALGPEIPAKHFNRLLQGR